MNLASRIFFSLVLVACSLNAQTRRDNFLSDNKKQNSLDTLIDNIIQTFMQSPENCGLSIGVLKNGKTFFYNYGETERNSYTLPSSSITEYEIGSLSATFCGLLLAQAVSEHLLNLNDDVRKFLPEKLPNLAYDKVPITVKYLANHTSGLPNIPNDLKYQTDFDSLNPYKHYDKSKIMNYLRTLELQREPGTVCEYSTFGIALLGIILERVYHLPFDTLIKEKICLPNQMLHTAVKLSEGDLKNLAEGHNSHGKTTKYWDMGDWAAAGGIKSTTQDLLNFLKYHLSENKATSIALTPNYIGKQTLGLTWFIKKTKQKNTLYWHNGATYGFSSFSGFIKEKNSAVIVLSNTSISVDYIGIAILNFLQQ